MSSVIISGDTSGAITVSAPAVAGTNTLTLQAATATNSVNTLSTAVASTSGTSIDFTSIPSWVKRVTVMFSAISTNGTANYLIQIGSGSVTTSGYSGYFGAVSFTAGFGINSAGAGNSQHGHMVITLISGNTYVASLVIGNTAGATQVGGGTSPALAGALDRVRITTSNGTDVFDAGTINLLLEG
jgi:hypothetical protein